MILGLFILLGFMVAYVFGYDRGTKDKDKDKGEYSFVLMTIDLDKFENAAEMIAGIKTISLKYKMHCDLMYNEIDRYLEVNGRFKK